MAFHFSNCGLACINILTLILSIPFLTLGTVMKKAGVTGCGLEADKFMITVGAILLVFSLLGLIASCLGWKWLLYIYIAAISIIILMGFVDAGISISVGSKGSGKAVPGKPYKEYNLTVYSRPIRLKLNEPKSWTKIKSCLVDSKICPVFNNKYINLDSIEKFNKIKSLNAVQSGCCKPADVCGFAYRGPTNWVRTNKSEENGALSNPDCQTWNNDPKILCYDCLSCKAGVGEIMKHAYKVVGTVSMIFLFLLIIPIPFAFIATRNIANHPQY